MFFTTFEFEVVKYKLKSKFKSQGVPRRETAHQGVRMSCDLVRTKRKSNLVEMLITLVVIFQLCYIRRGIMMITREFGNFSESSFHVRRYVRANPVLYQACT